MEEYKYIGIGNAAARMQVSETKMVASLRASGATLAQIQQAVDAFWNTASRLRRAS